MEWKQWHEILFNLLSGCLGALFLYLFQCRATYLKLKQERYNLVTVLLTDLKILLALFENGQEIESSKTATGIWRNITADMIELLPPGLTAEVIRAYQEVEIYSRTHITLQKDIKTTGAIKNAVIKIEDFLNNREEPSFIAGNSFYIHKRKFHR